MKFIDGTEWGDTAQPQYFKNPRRVSVLMFSQWTAGIGQVVDELIEKYEDQKLFPKIETRGPVYVLSVSNPDYEEWFPPEEVLEQIKNDE